MSGVARRTVHIAFLALLSVLVETGMAAVPEIAITKIPPIGERGYAIGKVIWDEITPENVNQYAVVAMLHAIWEADGNFYGEYYVKPYANNYLNPIDRNGDFRINITTGGVDQDLDEVTFFFVLRSEISDDDVASPSTMSTKFLSTKTIYRKTFTEPVPVSEKGNNLLVFIGALIGILIIGIIVFFYFKKQGKRQIEVDMFLEQGNLVCIRARINQLEFPFVVDSGAEISVISSTETNLLIANGQLSREDFSKTMIVKTVSGEELEGQIVNLKKFEIETEIIANIKALYVKNRNATAILGQDVLRHFAEHNTSYEDNKVIFITKRKYFFSKS
jgi:hypothetical protein